MMLLTFGIAIKWLRSLDTSAKSLIPLIKVIKMFNVSGLYQLYIEL